MPATSDLKALAEQASFVFKGRVQRLKASTMKEITADDRTATVRVDEIIHAPDVLCDCVGQTITVHLGEGAKAKQGEEAVFFTRPWILGDSIAVQSLDHHPVSRARAALKGAAGGEPSQNLAARNARARFDSADLVVSGRVTSVSLPTDAPVHGFAAKFEEGGATRRHISEHDPVIREAEIEVDRVHKGSHLAKTVRVRFPASHDVRWYTAPKFHAGQEGFFMLHKNEMSKAPEARKRGLVGAAAVSPDLQADAYTALHPADFQPLDESSSIEHLLGGSTGAGTPQDR